MFSVSHNNKANIQKLNEKKKCKTNFLNIYY